MASHLFLKLLDDEGALVKGEAQFKNYTDNWIELNGYNWSMEQRDELQGVPGQKPNYAKPEMFSFSKYADTSTTRMLQLHVDRKICKRAEFHFFEELEGTADATGGIFKLTISLTDVRIASCKIKGETDDKAITLEEDWEFDYGDITFDHKNAGAALLIEKPDDPESTNTKSDASGQSGASATPDGSDAVGTRDFLAPLGSL